jgi:hypothetical protein
MRAAAFVTTYNGLAAGPFISCCVDFLFAELPPLGTLLAELELYPHCVTAESVLPSLETLAARFTERLAELPITGVYRRRRYAFVSYRSAWIYRAGLFGRGVNHPDLSEFSLLTREMADALRLLCKKFRVTDDFDVAAFSAHVGARVASLPTTAGKLRALQSRYLALREAAGSAFAHS